MEEIDADLQLHGRYAGGVSKYMLIPEMAEKARMKGLGLLTTADVVHRDWLKHLKKNLIESNGVYTDLEGKCSFIIGGEVEDNKRIHHLFYLPSLEAAEELREKFLGKGNLDCIMCGRPKLRLSAEEIAKSVSEAGGIFGPAHSFTPYTGIYAFYETLKDAYGEMHKELKFIELGLSADTEMADSIKENHDYVYLTSSDAHSAWPHRMGREFNRIKMQKLSFAELKKAVEKRNEELITLNAGLNPKEGKYHATACNSCFAKYSLEQALELNWKCVRCRGQIKRGVRDRIKLLKNTEEKPKHRPPYLHTLPLAEIIQQSTKTGVMTKKVQSTWRDFIERFDNEINVLVDVKEEELREFNEEIAEKIIAFRKGFVLYIPGGGGDYGKPIICRDEKEMNETKIKMKNELEGINNLNQKNLTQF